MTTVGGVSLWEYSMVAREEGVWMWGVEKEEI